MKYDMDQVYMLRKFDIYHSNHSIIAWLDANDVTLIDNIIHNNHHEEILVDGNLEANFIEQAQ